MPTPDFLAASLTLLEGDATPLAGNDGGKPKPKPDPCPACGMG